VRHDGGSRLLHRPRLPRRVRARRRAHPAAVVRCLRQLRARLVDRERAGDGQRDQPKLSRAVGAGAGLARQPAHRRGERHGLTPLTGAAAGGLTLGIASNNVVIFPSVMKTLPFDMPGDFTPIAVVGYTPVVLVVNPKVPAKDAKEFVALLKSRNGDMTYASG